MVGAAGRIACGVVLFNPLLESGGVGQAAKSGREKGVSGAGDEERSQLRLERWLVKLLAVVWIVGMVMGWRE